MEELEALDKKALEQQYVDSYKYSGGQKILAGGCAITVLAGLIIGGTYLFVNLLDIIVK
jgi:hypothetical protein